MTDTSAPALIAVPMVAWPENAESARSNGRTLLPRSMRRSVARVSAMILAAPFGEPVFPCRNRWARITGAEVVVNAVATRALRPRTPAYPNDAPCFWYPWTSMIVSSTSTITRSPSRICSSGAADARFTSVREATASSWRTCPNRNSRRNEPSVDGAYVRSNNRPIPP